MLIGDIKVKVLEQGVHSGTAGGVVTSSFLALRQLISRFENEVTGEISPSFLNEQIPESRRQRAAALHHGKICPAPTTHHQCRRGEDCLNRVADERRA